MKAKEPPNLPCLRDGFGANTGNVYKVALGIINGEKAPVGLQIWQCRTCGAIGWFAHGLWSIDGHHYAGMAHSALLRQSRPLWPCPNRARPSRRIAHRHGFEGADCLLIDE